MTASHGTALRKNGLNVSAKAGRKGICAFLYPLAHQCQLVRVPIEEGRIVLRHATPTDPCGTRDLAKEIAAVGCVRFDVILCGDSPSRHLHNSGKRDSRIQPHPPRSPRGVMTARTALRKNGLNVSAKADRN